MGAAAGALGDPGELSTSLDPRVEEARNSMIAHVGLGLVGVTTAKGTLRYLWGTGMQVDSSPPGRGGRQGLQ